MIVLARVDDRLVHGQVTAGWVPHVRASRLVVANDRLAADPLLASIVRAGGGGLAVEILEVEAAAGRFAAGAWESEPVVLLFESLQDALRALAAGLVFTRLNLGGLRHDCGSVCLREGITLDTTDCGILRELQRSGVEIDVRLMPRDRACALPRELKVNA
jgi:mannose/fructose/N-acetylgalactosamine-specific phosphotransferase system component IIB